MFHGYGRVKMIGVKTKLEVLVPNYHQKTDVSFRSYVAGF